MNPLQIPAVSVAAVVSLVLFATTGDGRADQYSAMNQRPQWEYKVEHCSFHSGLATQLDRLGNEGWELVQIADGAGVFKRMKTSHDKPQQSAVQIELLQDGEVIVLRGKEEDVRGVATSMRQIEQHRSNSTPLEKDGEQGHTNQQASKEQEKAESSPSATKYESMEKQDLQQELRRLQKELLDAERVAKQAKGKAAEAAAAYKSASDDEKADALLRMIEGDAASRKPMERYSQTRSAFETAQRAYLHLLIAE